MKHVRIEALSLMLDQIPVGENANQQFTLKTSEILNRIERGANQWKIIKKIKERKITINEGKLTKEK